MRGGGDAIVSECGGFQIFSSKHVFLPVQGVKTLSSPCISEHHFKEAFRTAEDHRKTEMGGGTHTHTHTHTETTPSRPN